MNAGDSLASVAVTLTVVLSGGGAELGAGAVCVWGCWFVCANSKAPHAATKKANRKKEATLFGNKGRF